MLLRIGIIFVMNVWLCECYVCMCMCVVVFKHVFMCMDACGWMYVKKKLSFMCVSVCRVSIIVHACVYVSIKVCACMRVTIMVCASIYCRTFKFS